MRRALAAFLLLAAIVPLPSLAATTQCLCSYEGTCESLSGVSELDCLSSSISAPCKALSVSASAEWVSDSDSFMGAQSLERCAATKQTYLDDNPTVSSTAGLTPNVAYATPTLQVKIPGVDFNTPLGSGTIMTVDFLSTYVSGVYRYLIGFAMTIAIVMLMVGGLQYVLGASSGDVSKAKKRITDAIEGFVLLMFVYVILVTVNPELTMFRALKIKSIAEVPLDSLLETFDDDGTPDTPTGAALYGKSAYQDCMLKKFGDAPSLVKTTSVTMNHLGKSRSYQVNQAAAADFQAAFDAIKSENINYDITRDTGGNTLSWRGRRSDSSRLSNHSWGTAIDINPDKNPYCERSCFDNNSATTCVCLTSGDCKTICESRKYDLPERVIEIFLEHNFNWLGDRQKMNKNTTDLEDYMHFDWVTGCE